MRKSKAELELGLIRAKCPEQKAGQVVRQHLAALLSFGAFQRRLMQSAGNGVAASLPPSAQPKAKAESNGTVDFSKMTAAQKVAYHKARWDRILG